MEAAAPATAERPVDEPPVPAPGVQAPAAPEPVVVEEVAARPVPGLPLDPVAGDQVAPSLATTRSCPSIGSDDEEAGLELTMGKQASVYRASGGLAGVATLSGVLAQCRFCLDEAPVEELIAPCSCEGTSRFVHDECLRRWQREAGGDNRASICQVCCAEFSLRPSVVIWRPDRLGIHAAHSLPVFDAVRTNPRYDHTAVESLPGPLRERLASLLGVGCLVLQTPSRTEMEVPHFQRQRGDNVMALFEAVLLARIAHWHRGVYLIGAAWPGEATDGSDAIIGVNLAGARTQLLGRLGALRHLEAKLGDVPLEGALGGPVRPDRNLVLVAVKAEPPESALGTHVRFIPGGGLGAEEAHAGCAGALFGEPDHVAEVLDQHPDLRPVSALALQGHAVWSSAQLLSEVARGSWGLTPVLASDLVSLPLCHEHQSASWELLWTTRGVLAAAPQTVRRERDDAAAVWEERTVLPGHGCSGGCARCAVS